MLLTADNLSFSYPCEKSAKNEKGEKNAREKGVFGINFGLCAGKVLALVGSNGSGKTTLLNLLYQKYKAGGEAVFVPQFFNISAISVRDFIGLGLVRQFGKFQITHNAKQRAQIEKIIETTGLSGIANMPLTKISGGERQIVKIAQSLVIKPKILLLDEPTSHLDLSNSTKVLSLVRQICETQNACAVIVIHDVYAARKFADFVLTLKDGRQFGFCEAKDFDDEKISELFGI